MREANFLKSRCVLSRIKVMSWTLIQSERFPNKCRDQVRDDDEDEAQVESIDTDIAFLRRIIEH